MKGTQYFILVFLAATVLIVFALLGWLVVFGTLPDVPQWHRPATHTVAVSPSAAPPTPAATMGLIIQSISWQEDGELHVHLTVNNQGEGRLLLEPAQFWVIDQRGHEYAAASWEWEGPVLELETGAAVSGELRFALPQLSRPTLLAYEDESRPIAIDVTGLVESRPWTKEE